MLYYLDELIRDLKENRIIIEKIEKIWSLETAIEILNKVKEEADK